MAEMMFSVDEPGTENTFEPLAPGDYPLIAVDSSIEVTSSGTGRYAKYSFEVTDGPARGRRVFHNFNLWNPSEKATQIAKAQFNEFCKACGFPSGANIKDTADLHALPFRASISVEKSEGYAPQNRIKKFISSANGAATRAATAATQAAAASGGGAKPPWQK